MKIERKKKIMQKSLKGIKEFFLLMALLKGGAKFSWR